MNMVTTLVLREASTDLPVTWSASRPGHRAWDGRGEPVGSL